MIIFKIIGKYIGIGILIGIGLAISEYLKYQLMIDSRYKDLEKQFQMLEDMKESSIIFANQLSSNDLPDEYYDPNNKLHFDLQSYTDLGERIQISGIVSNQSEHIWKNIFLDFEATDKRNILIGECKSRITNLAPKEWEGVVVECPKLEKFKDSIITSVRMSIKFNFRGKKVVLHYK